MCIFLPFILTFFTIRRLFFIDYSLKHATINLIEYVSVLFDELEVRGQSVEISRVTSMTNFKRCPRRSEVSVKFTYAGVRLNKSSTVTTS